LISFFVAITQKSKLCENANAVIPFVCNSFELLYTFILIIIMHIISLPFSQNNSIKFGLSTLIGSFIKREYY